MSFNLAAVVSKFRLTSCLMAHADSRRTDVVFRIGRARNSLIPGHVKLSPEMLRELG